MGADGAGFDFTGPADDEGDTESAFVEIAFAASEFDTGFGVDVGAEETAGVLFAAEAVLPTVVAGEEDDGVFVEVEFFEKVENHADVAVDHGDHGGVVFNVL